MIVHPVARFSKQDIIERLGPDGVIDLARGCGLRLAGRPNSQGWIAAHAIGRADANPSAGINVRTGHYRDHGGAGESLGFFDFMARYGGFGDWRAARDHCAALAGLLPSPQARRRAARTSPATSPPAAGGPGGPDLLRRLGVSGITRDGWMVSITVRHADGPRTDRLSTDYIRTGLEWPRVLQIFGPRARALITDPQRDDRPERYPLRPYSVADLRKAILRAAFPAAKPPADEPLPRPAWYTSKCFKASGIIMQSTTNSKCLVLDLRCGCWSCEHCSHHLRQDWLDHLSQLFRQHERLYVFRCTRAAWPAIASQRRRGHWQGQYVRIFDGRQEYTVISSGPAGAPDETMVSADAAVSTLREKLAGLPLEVQRPVSTSAGWRPRRERSGHEWTRVARLPDEAVAAGEEAARRLGLRCARIGINGACVVRAALVEGDSNMIENWIDEVTGVSLPMMPPPKRPELSRSG